MNDPKAFIEYSNDMCNIYKNINYYNPYKENKILIVFDDMNADMIKNKSFDSTVTELFIIGRKLNISLAFITQSNFKVSKNVRLNTTYFFITKIPDRGELKQIAINHSSDIIALKISLISTENVLLNHFRFLLMILRLHQIIL